MTNITLIPITEELDADTVSALGLDPTGRSGDPRFPYTLGWLDVPELLRLMLLGDEATHYPDEALEPETALWYESALAELRRRVGDEALENLAAYALDSHASIADLIRSAQENVEDLLAVIRQTVAA